MTKPAARTVANVVLFSAGVAAAYVVFTTPPLRRLVGLASRRWLGASLPVFLLTEARHSWVESGQRRSGESSPQWAGDDRSAQHAGRPLT